MKDKGNIKKLKLMLFDIDGVMTDGGIIIDANGCETKKFDVKDGHGIKLLMRGGVEVGIISGRKSKVVDYRAKELSIDLVFQDAKNKLEVYEHIKSLKNLKDEEIGFMGDDIIDIPVMKRAGFSAAPPDASAETRHIADLITSKEAGKGAVREVCELILKEQGMFDEVFDKYLSA